jgi:hypothetical protein
MENAEVILKGHFDGQSVVLDEAMPPEVIANTPVKVVVELEVQEHVLARIARLARAGGLPPDFSQQHEHYVKRAPRR